MDMLGDYDLQAFYTANAAYIKFGLENFCLIMFAIAVFFILLHKLIVRSSVSEYEIVYRWLALFPLGGTFIYLFVLNAYYPDMVNTTLGWKPSPFQYEVAVADLALGILAILSFNASYGFRLATVLASSLFLIGCALNHIDLVIVQGTVNTGDIGAWLWMTDLIMPLLMLLTIMGLSRNRTV
jgi:hypothetical protein